MSVETSTFEEEIDLRALAETVWNGRKTIVLTTLAVALLTLGISMAMPRQYQASAYVFVGPPPIEFSKSISEIDLNLAFTVPDIQSAIGVAVAPGLLQSVLQDKMIAEALTEKITLETFAGRLKAEAMGKNQIRLQATDTDPSRAALIANIWAQKVTETINASFALNTLAQTLPDQTKQAHQNYQQAQAELEQALAESQVDALKARLERKKDDLSSVLASLVRTQRVLDDLATFEQQLQGLPADAPISLGHGLTLTTLHQRALTVDSESFIVQVDSASFANLTIAQARETSAKMEAALHNQLQRLQDEQVRLEQEIPQIESELSKADALLDEFITRRDQAQSLYKALLSRQQLVQALQQNSHVASVSVLAVPPQKKSAPRVGLNTLLAGTLGLMLSGAWVLVENWWKNSQSA